MSENRGANAPQVLIRKYLDAISQWENLWAVYPMQRSGSVSEMNSVFAKASILNPQLEEITAQLEKLGHMLSAIAVKNGKDGGIFLLMRPHITSERNRARDEAINLSSAEIRNSKPDRKNKKLSPAALLAWTQYKEALEINPSLASAMPRTVYASIEKSQSHLVSFSTWSRYIRKAKSHFTSED